MHISNLVIEVTRRCNADCSHCLRGEPQLKDLSLVYVDALFQKIRGGIGNLTFSGGEPSLVPEVLKGVLDLAQKHGIDVGGFYITTNAYAITTEFLVAVIRWYAYCEEKEMCAINWSAEGWPNMPKHDREYRGKSCGV